MFLKRILRILPWLFILGIGASTAAANEYDMNEFILPGKYKLISGPREFCGKLEIAKSDIQKDLAIGPWPSIKAESFTHKYPAEIEKGCPILVENKVSQDKAGNLVIKFSRSESCANKVKPLKRIEANFKKGTIEIADTIYPRPPDKCVWKFRSSAQESK